MAPTPVIKNSNVELIPVPEVRFPGPMEIGGYRTSNRGTVSLKDLLYESHIGTYISTVNIQNKMQIYSD